MSLLETVKSSICKGKRDPRKGCAGDFLREELSSRSLSPAVICGVWLPAGQAGGAHRPAGRHPHPFRPGRVHAAAGVARGADGGEMAALGQAEDEGMRGGCCGKVPRP